MKLILTNKGKELITSSLQSGEKISFTKIKTSSYQYTTENIDTLTELEDIKQESLVSSINKISNTNLELIAMITNKDLVEGYFIKSIGIYAHKGTDDDILYGVCIKENNHDYLSSVDIDGLTTLSYKINITIDDTDIVNMSISLLALPTLTEVNNIKDKVNEGNTLIKEHTSSTNIDADGAHGLRYNKDEQKLQYRNDTDNGWEDITSGPTNAMQNIFKITFDTEFKGNQYQITNNRDQTIITGVVPDNLVEIVNIPMSHTQYTIRSTINGKEYNIAASTTDIFKEYDIKLSVYRGLVKVYSDLQGTVIDVWLHDTIIDTFVIENNIPGNDDAYIYEYPIYKLGRYSFKGRYGVFISEETYGHIMVENNKTEYTVNVLFAILLITTKKGYNITCAQDNTIVSEISVGENKILLPNKGNWNITISDGVRSKSKIIKFDYRSVMRTWMSIEDIYGTYISTARDFSGNYSWDSRWRTYDSESISDYSIKPLYGSGATFRDFGSKFDDIMPWKGIEKVDRPGGVMVKIPKFWYKLQKHNKYGQSQFEISIANKPLDGFKVSPAHSKRGGSKERDYIFVGRYKSSGSALKSVSGGKPVSMSLSNARNVISKIPNTYHIDYLARMTIEFLFIVEFNSFASQEKLARGGLDPNKPIAGVNTGYTDNLMYCTGSIGNYSSDPGPKSHYRYIEGLWENGNEYTDGIYTYNRGLYLNLDPKTSKRNNSGITLLKSGSSVYGDGPTGIQHIDILRDIEGVDFDIYYTSFMPSHYYNYTYYGLCDRRWHRTDTTNTTYRMVNRGDLYKSAEVNNIGLFSYEFKPDGLYNNTFHRIMELP